MTRGLSKLLANLMASFIIIGLSSLVSENSYNAKYKMDNSIPPFLKAVYRKLRNTF